MVCLKMYIPIVCIVSIVIHFQTYEMIQTNEKNYDGKLKRDARKKIHND